MDWKPSGHFKEPTPINHLPRWQRGQLKEYREQRVLQKVEPGRGLWVRKSDGSLVTEVDLYWAQVAPLKDGKIGFRTYSKKAGQMARFYPSYDTEKEAMAAAVAWMLRGENPSSTTVAEDVKAEPAPVEQPEDARLRTELALVEAIVVGAGESIKKFADFIPEGDKKPELEVKIYLEYLYFFLHVTNRLASKVASYQEVDRMYNTIGPWVVDYVLHKAFNSVTGEARQELSKAIPELIRVREMQYAESKEYASKDFKPLSGTSTVDMLVRNIRELLDTYNPEDLFQIQLAARESMHEAKIPELIAKYRNAHPI